jgi:hypothetical protein
MKIKIINNKSGMILPLVLVFGTIALLILGGIVSWGLLNFKASRQAVQKEIAFQIAESGNEYYRWHLAHAPTDYQDGTGVSGPYIHPFYDKSNNRIGEFSLTITPPLIGSSIVTVKSSGKSDGRDYSGERSIITSLAKPSLAKFSVAANNAMRFGAGTIVNGPIHSNNGIRFDGLANNLVTSALAEYNDPDHTETGGDKNEFGVHTHVNPPPDSGTNEAFRPLEAPPSAIQPRSDIFTTGRQFPVPAVDFTGFTADISQMKTDAQANGFYRAASGALGYQVVLKTDDTFDLYRVDTLTAPPAGCVNSQSQDGWGTWSINTRTIIGNFPFPENGLIFLEDDVYAEGQINTARITIAAAIFPDDINFRKSITVNNDLLYTSQNGQDVISLIAQKNINVGLFSDDVLRIDAALIAQTGRVGRYYYRYGTSYCSPDAVKSTITLYGMIASNQRYGFAYSGTPSTGYQTRNIQYDSYLIYSPPPSFPQTSDQYITLSWGEVK